MKLLKRSALRTLPLLLLFVISQTFMGCQNQQSPFLMNNGATGFGKGGFGFGNTNGNNNSGGPIDIGGSTGGQTQQQRQQEQQFYATCDKLQTVADKLYTGCGALIEHFRTHEIPQFSQFIASCASAFQVVFAPYCSNSLGSQLQNAVNVCVGVFRNAPWQTIMTEDPGSAKFVQEQANLCVSAIQSL